MDFVQSKYPKIYHMRQGKTCILTSKRIDNCVCEGERECIHTYAHVYMHLHICYSVKVGSTEKHSVKLVTNIPSFNIHYTKLRATNRFLLLSCVVW